MASTSDFETPQTPSIETLPPEWQARRPGSVRLLAGGLAAVGLVVLSLLVWLAVSKVIEARADARWRQVAADLRTLATALEVQALKKELPKTAPGSVEELAGVLAPHLPGRPVPVRDPWGRPYVLVVHSEGQRYLLASAGADRTWEAEVGGPFLREQTGRDLVLADGEMLQYPEAFLLDGPRAELEKKVAEGREAARKRWLAPAMAEARAGWSQLGR